MWPYLLIGFAVFTTSACAFVAVLWATRATAIVSSFADFKHRVVACEANIDRCLEMQRKLAVRLNLEEGKRENPPTKPAAKKLPSWETDPEGFIREHSKPLANRGVL